jgi:hypothetical protein
MKVMKATPTALACYLALLVASASLSFGQEVTWIGGGTTNAYNNNGNWDTGLTPTTGDTAVIGATGDTVGPFTVSLTFGSIMQNADAHNIFGSTVMQRNSNAQINMGGTVSFSDNSSLIASYIVPDADLVMNWDSEGTWSNAGSTTVPFITLGAANVLNMSSGRWELFGNSHPNSLDVNTGTINMNGGRILMDDGMRINGGNFNLGGSGEVFFTSSVTLNFFGGAFNFQGINSALYLVGTDNTTAFDTRLGFGRISIDGTTATSLTEFNITNVNIEGDDFTRISVVPEPATYAAILGLAGLACCILRRRKGR